MNKNYFGTVSTDISVNYEVIEKNVNACRIPFKDRVPEIFRVVVSEEN